MKNAGMGVSESAMREGFEKHDIQYGNRAVAKAKQRLSTMLGDTNEAEGDPNYAQGGCLPESGHKIEY